jgi:hypothetical protein
MFFILTSIAKKIVHRHCSKLDTNLYSKYKTPGLKRLEEGCMGHIPADTIMDSVAFGAIGFIFATFIDHELGISCPELWKIGVPGWRLLFHKIMYFALGVGTVCVFLYLTPH